MTSKMKAIICYIKTMPTVDVVKCAEREKGEWMIGENENDGWCKCSVCGYVNLTCEVYSVDGNFNYCPNCGCQMKGEKE